MWQLFHTQFPYIAKIYVSTQFYSWQAFCPRRGHWFHSRSGGLSPRWGNLVAFPSPYIQLLKSYINMLIRPLSFTFFPFCSALPAFWQRYVRLRSKQPGYFGCDPGWCLPIIFKSSLLLEDFKTTTNSTLFADYTAIQLVRLQDILFFGCQGLFFLQWYCILSSVILSKNSCSHLQSFYCFYLVYVLLVDFTYLLFLCMTLMLWGLS
jgi:hypothetical protein